MTPDEMAVVAELHDAAGAFMEAETLENGSRLVRARRQVEEALAEERHTPVGKASQ